jgi:hypothetical protein
VRFAPGGVRKGAAGYDVLHHRRATSRPRSAARACSSSSSGATRGDRGLRAHGGAIDRLVRSFSVRPSLSATLPCRPALRSARGRPEDARCLPPSAPVTSSASARTPPCRGQRLGRCCCRHSACDRRPPVCLGTAIRCRRNTRPPMPSTAATSGVCWPVPDVLERLLARRRQLGPCDRRQATRDQRGSTPLQSFSTSASHAPGVRARAGATAITNTLHLTTTASTPA